MVNADSVIVEGHFDPNIPRILPHDKMYSIQIGTKLFKISGASLSSDGPSYFTNYFIKKDLENKCNSDLTTTPTVERNNNNNNDTDINCPNNSNSNDPWSPSTSTFASNSTLNGLHASNSRQSTDILFIDRSPKIFELIYQHLQGYFINIKDEVEYTMLIADAVYYNLPRLKALLKNSEFFYTKVGDKSFKFPKALLKRNGDTQNYFQITTDFLYVDVENLILVKKLLRPPPHSYSIVPRSPKYFEMLLDLLNGCRLHLDDELRESLIQECRFYRFLNLEQRLIKCQIAYDPFLNLEEICLSLDKIVKNGLIITDKSPLNVSTNPYVVDIKEKISNSSENTESSNNNNNNFKPFKDVPHIDSIQENHMVPDDYAISCDTMHILDMFKSSDDISNDKTSDIPNLDFTSIEPSLKKPKLKAESSDYLTTRSSDIVSNWDFVYYKRPFIDEYERILNFQLNTKECSITYRKADSKIFLDLVGDIAKKFESVFGSTLMRLKNINLQDYKVDCSEDDTSNCNNNENTHVHKIFIKFNTHLLIPACLDFANIVINNQLFEGNLNEYFNKKTENVLNLNNPNKNSKFTLGQYLHLSKSIWKLAINHSDGSIVLVAVKVNGYTNLKVWGQQLEFI